MHAENAIKPLSPKMEGRIRRNPLLNMDTFIIPSPFIRDASLEKDYDHSLVWMEEGEILGYLLVYSDAEKENFHIYKLVTSPFGRGRGIGQAFITHLARSIPDGAGVYLYLWEKQTDTLDFFHSRGFHLGESIVYRNLVYYHISAKKQEILFHAQKGQLRDKPGANEIGKTRHDARKIVRLLSHMVETLSPENCDKIVEDINRESTTLINMLNMFRDSRKTIHEVNLKQLVLERILPYVEAYPLTCAVHLELDTRNPVILGYYENVGRALINLISNSLEAIEEAGRPGVIHIRLRDEGEIIILSITDNGSGIPRGLLEKTEEGFPLFVGLSTKERKEGEGLGTLQIYSTFGAENLDVQSERGKGTTWTVRFSRSPMEVDRGFARMERRFNEFLDLWENYDITAETSRTDTIAFIWQERKMELFLFDLILMFSNYQNIRTIYRQILDFFHGDCREEDLRSYIAGLRGDNEVLREWLLEITLEIRRRQTHFFDRVPSPKDYLGAMFKSYGQSVDNVIIFTMDPESGWFFATDRKLAEHLDFVPYLEKERDLLLRGEFVGDINNNAKPVYFGVWSVESEKDLVEKLLLIRQGARKLIEMGIHREKKLAFYQTTYIRYTRDIDTYATTTFAELASTPDEEITRFIRQADEEMFNFIVPVD